MCPTSRWPISSRRPSHFGAINDHGPGVFLAAAAGITPFIPILKKHQREGVTGMGVDKDRRVTEDGW